MFQHFEIEVMSLLKRRPLLCSLRSWEGPHPGGPWRTSAPLGVYSIEANHDIGLISLNKAKLFWQMLLGNTWWVGHEAGGSYVVSTSKNVRIWGLISLACQFCSKTQKQSRTIEMSWSCWLRTNKTSPLYLLYIYVCLTSVRFFRFETAWEGPPAEPGPLYD